MKSFASVFAGDTRVSYQDLSEEFKVSLPETDGNGASSRFSSYLGQFSQTISFWNWPRHPRDQGAMCINPDPLNLQ